MMTVADLIKELEKAPQEMLVFMKASEYLFEVLGAEIDCPFDNLKIDVLVLS